MELQYYNKNDMNITIECNKSSYLSDLLSWQTIYLNNDIHIFNFDRKESKIKMFIFFKKKFNECILDLDNLDLITDCCELKIKANTIKSNSDNLYLFLENLGTYLDLVNETHDKYVPTNNNNNNKENTKDKYEWNPYIYLHIKKDYTFDLNKLKTNSLTFYKNNSFNCQNLDITKEHIIEVISQELKQIDNNKLYSIITCENLFEFDIQFKNFTNSKLESDLKDNNLTGIKMNIKLNHNLYPFYPPTISFKNKLDNNLDYVINKLSYFNPKNWNPTNTLCNMLTQIHEILNTYANIKNIISEDFESLESLIQNIISKNNIKINNIKKWDDIKINYTKLSETDNKTKTDSKFWNSGVGYGTNGRQTWDIKKYVEEIRVKLDQELIIIRSIDQNIIDNKDSQSFHSYIINSNLLDILIDYFGSFNIVEIDDEHRYKILKHIISITKNLDLLNWEDILVFELGLIAKNLKNFCNEIDSYLKLNKDIQSERKSVFIEILTLYDNIKKYDLNTNIEVNTDKYCETMKDYQFSQDNNGFEKYYYHKENKNSDKPSKLCITKLTKELATYNNSLPMNYESSIYVRYDPNNIKNIKALIIGPKDTPYENGCYIFDILIPSDYPSNPPLVNLQTTGGGSVRFNPNLYNTGKVCLSLLGTWSGNGGEKWNKDTSTLLQVLVSIQSLILVENPYFNEPGYERDMHNESGKRKNFEYNDKRRFWNLKWAINDNIENPTNEFKNVINNHFKLKKDDIINTINKWYSETQLKNDFNVTKNKCINLLNEL